MAEAQAVIAQTAVPAHVQPHLVYDYDYVDDPRLKPDPFAGVARLREDAPPIFYTPRNGGHWVVMTHRDAFEIGRNSDVFGNRSPGATFIPATIDPPHHTAYRAVLNKVFAPHKVRELSGQVRRDRILMHYPVIGIDPAAYPDPEKIIEWRKEPALVFGIGRHRCVGSHLARMELVIFLEEWLSRIPMFRLDSKNPPRLHAGHVFGVEKMNLLWGGVPQ